MSATAIHLVIIYTSHWFRKSQMLIVWKIRHVEMLGVNLKLFLILYFPLVLNFDWISNVTKV